MKMREIHTEFNKNTRVAVWLLWIICIKESKFCWYGSLSLFITSAAAAQWRPALEESLGSPQSWLITFLATFYIVLAKPGIFIVLLSKYLSKLAGKHWQTSELKVKQVPRSPSSTWMCFVNSFGSLPVLCWHCSKMLATPPEKLSEALIIFSIIRSGLWHTIRSTDEGESCMRQLKRVVS